MHYLACMIHVYAPSNWFPLWTRESLCLYTSALSNTAVWISIPASTTRAQLCKCNWHYCKVGFKVETNSIQFCANMARLHCLMKMQPIHQSCFNFMQNWWGMVWCCQCTNTICIIYLTINCKSFQLSSVIMRHLNTKHNRLREPQLDSVVVW